MVKFNVLSLLVGLALVLGACSPASDAAVSTAVAQTVEARFTQIAESSATPSPTAVSTPPTPTATATSTPVSSNPGCLLAANLMGETVPDDTIFKPGETFWKTWQIKNSGSCTWDSTYKLVFWDGNLMGGAYVYNFPQAAIPGEIVDVTIQLWAPAEAGAYKGSWMIQSPWGAYLGVGEYNAAMYAQIVVSSEKHPTYGITGVNYNVVRDPTYGCQANVRYTIYATITVNGAAHVVYYWTKSDDTQEGKGNIKFKEAGSAVVSVSWQLHWGAATNPRWVMLHTITDDEVVQDWGKASFNYDCLPPG